MSNNTIPDGVALGARVKDVTSGFEGYVVGHMIHLTGCDQFVVRGDSFENRQGHTSAVDAGLLEAIKDDDGNVKTLDRETRPLSGYPNAIPLGSEGVDKVSGLKGIVTGMARYIAGADRYSLVPKAKKNKRHEGLWIDEGQIEVTQKNKVAPERVATKGRPGPAPEVYDPNAGMPPV